MKSLYLAVLLIATLFSGFASAEVAVIVHPSNADTISQDDVNAIFLGKKKSFPGGSSAVPMVLNDATADEFNTKILGKSARHLHSYWSKLVFTVKANPPNSVSADEMLSLIKSNPNLIGFFYIIQVTAYV